MTREEALDIAKRVANGATVRTGAMSIWIDRSLVIQKCDHCRCEQITAITAQRFDAHVAQIEEFLTNHKHAEPPS